MNVHFKNQTMGEYGGAGIDIIGPSQGFFKVEYIDLTARLSCLRTRIAKTQLVGE